MAQPERGGDEARVHGRSRIVALGFAVLFGAGPPSEGEERSGELRILTYNLWHARVRAKRAEPEPERVARHRLQIEAIRRLDPDVVLLQEVSPAGELGRMFAEELGLDVRAAVANCGVQVRLPGRQGEFGRRIGKPQGLVEGLTILARPELGLDWDRRVKLSGPPALVSSGLCLQFAETKYAAMAAIAVPDAGTVIVADVHLHASATPGDEFLDGLAALVASGEVSAQIEAKLKRTIEEGDARRQREAARLIEALGTLERRLERAGIAVVGTVVAGDLNVAPASPLLAWLRERGFEDAVASHGDPAMVTWDPVQNAIVQRIQTLRDPARQRPFADASPALAALYASPAGQERPRRLDYVLLSAPLATKVSRVERFEPRTADGRDLSDHYGLLVVIDGLAATSPAQPQTPASTTAR